MHGAQFSIKGFIVFMILCFILLDLSAQNPDYSGTWKLNLEKSRLESMPEDFTGSLFIIEQTENKFQLTRYHFFGDNKKRIKIRMVADGQTHHVKLLFKGRLEWHGDTLQSVLFRKNFSNIVNYNFGASQNEFIADEIMKSPAENHHNIWVFDREIIKNEP